VLISGVLYEGYQLGQEDEAIQLINVGPLPVNLKNYIVTNRTAPGVSFTGSYTLQVNQRVWVTKNAFKFYDSFGFWPDFAVTGTLTNEVKPVSGSWPGGSLGDSGDVQLKDTVGNVLDRLVYGGYALPSSGWSGPTVYYYNLGGKAGQILARALDERTGLPIMDTDTAADWMQYTGNYTTGRRVMYPGWDMDLFFWPYTSTMPATITLGVAPDNAFDVVSQALRSAQRSIEIEAYELKNYGVITEIVQQAWRGVSVTVLLEGEPASGVDNQERWACQEIEAAGGQCWFMHNDSDSRIYDRYDLVHAKLIIVDRERLVISTQNMSGGGMPDDDKSDGTYGSRGYLLYIESRELAERAAQIFDHDLDPAHHHDIARWGAFGFVMPITPVVPITITGGTTSSVLFPTPQSVTDATHFELFTVPEAALRQSDALLGLVAQAQDGDEVYVEQMYEYPNWGDDITAPNLRLRAYVDAARRGAQVRILLNSGMFDQEYVDLSKNITTTTTVNEVARQEELDLQARVGNPTLYGIHSKIVLVKLHNKGKAYSHVGSINGSEQSSKINREIAVQVESQNLYTELARVFQTDWNLAGPIFLPVVMRNYRAADHVVISEVLYDPYGSIDTGKEWIELYNPTSSAIDISDWSLGDAASDGEYGSGRYLFPDGTLLQPGGVVVIAQQAVSVTFMPDFEFVVVPALDNPTVPNMNTIVSTWDGFGLALGNQGDHVILLNAAGRLVDAVVWGDASYPGTLPYSNEIWSDHSLERSPANRDTDDCAADFRDRYPSTPGALP
jgi:phosphatidylserine/phosphatidylglycerophosphate/cardiolipin synthase-like enzyme